MESTIKPTAQTKIMCLEHDLARDRQLIQDLKDELNAANKVILEIEKKYNAILEVAKPLNNKE